MKIPAFVMIATFAAAPVSAHIVVAPAQSQPGASQIYKVRVHNEEKIATTSIELDVPDGVTVVKVAPIATGGFTTAKSGDRIVKVTWNTEIPPGKYVELAFTATNPAKAGQLQWNVHQRMADGTVLEWNDAPGAHGKPSMTKIAPSDPAAPPK